MRFFDTLTNFVANIGVGTSKKVFDQYALNALDDQTLEAMYRGDFLSRKVVDAPVNDIFRPWRSWQAMPEQITAMEAAEKRHQVRLKLALAAKWGRLYGGSVVIIGTGGNASLPLVPATVGKGGLRYLTVLPRKIVQVPELETDPIQPNFATPKMYRLNGKHGQQVDIHPSRIIRFLGAPRPDIDTNTEGWGDSILQVVNDALHNASLSMAGVSELVHEAKVDIVKIKNLGTLLSTDAGTKLLLDRFRNSGMLKSINNTLLLDAEDEHSRVQTAFTGLPDVIRVFLEVVAAASDIPVTRLLGTSAKGLNATGEGDMRNYYDFLDGWRKDNLAPVLDILDPLLWQDETGSVPKDAYYEFNPLWQMTEKEKAELAKSKAETTRALSSLGLIPEEPFARALVNQLIEDGTYPGLEAEMADLLASGADIVPEERPDDDVRPARNGQTKARDEEGLGAPGDRAADWRGARLSAHPEFARWLSDAVGSQQRH